MTLNSQPSTLNYAAALDAEALFHAVWRAEFEPIIAEKRRVRTEQQTEAFLDTTLTLCGEEVRQMTPADLLTLDALGNPYVAGGETGFIDGLALIWQLSPENNQTASFSNLWRRARMRHRLADQPAPDMHAEIVAYVARMFSAGVDEFYAADESDPTSTFAPELKTHFLSPLLVGLCAKIGPTDPLSGELLAHVPLPRLLQYKATTAEAEGDKQYSETDSLRNRCIERTAQLMAERRAPCHCEEPEATRQSS